MSLGQGSTGLLRDFYGGDVIIDQVRIWSSKLSAEAIREAYNNAGLDPALYQDLDAQLSFDKLIDVKGKLYAEDDSGNENDASYGHWPAMKQSLMTATHGIQPISKPRMVGSRADLYGKDIVIYVHPGPPAVFPSTEDSILGWDFICDICSEKQYGVFKFADPVYINSATLFEINAGGSLYKFSASSSWEGSDTKWTTLWEGEAGPLPENAARAFTPPLCPEVQEKFQYVRLDFDPAAVPGWNNHDGMSLRGSFEFPPGQDLDGCPNKDALWWDLREECSTRMHDDMWGVPGTTPLDEFTYVASDCLDEGKEGAPVKMVVRDPAPGTGSLFAAARQTSHYLIGDKVVVDLGVEVAVEALGSSLGTDDYAARMDEIHVQIMAPTNTSMSDFEKFQISSSEDERIDLQGSAMHTISRVSSGGGSGGYRVNIENTDRSLDSITLHMWITFPSKFITFRTEVHLAAKCHDSIEDPAECASTEFDCLGTGSGFISDMKRCFSSCNPGYEPQQAPDTQNGTESVTCTPCPAGAFSNGRGAACVPCSPGFISFAEGSAACSICREGEYMDESGGTRCKLCDPGFSQEINAILQTTNSNGSAFPFIPNSLLHCKPLPGYYGQPGAKAKVCPEGGVCCHCQPGSFDTFGDGLAKLDDIDGFNYNEYCTCLSGTMPFPYPTKGFVRSDEEGYEEKLVECGNADACAGALAVSSVEEAALVSDEQSRADMLEDVKLSRTYPWTSGHCSRGYTGRLCMECDNGFFSTNGLCLRCPDGFGARLGFTLSAFVAVVAAWVFLGVTMAGTYISLSILLMYLQIGSMLQTFSMKWPETVNQWALVQTIVNFDVDLITPQCVIENYGFEWSYYLQLLLPLIVLAANWLSYSVKAHRIRRSSVTEAVQAHELEQLLDGKISTVTSFAEVVYHSLCIRCFQAWVCESMGDDLQYLVAAPNIECWEGRHIIMVVVSILALFVYVIGIPSFYAGVMHYGYTHDLLVSESFAAKFGWMYSAYELDWYWWIMMICARRLVCAALLVFLA
eukprot:gene3066-3894_t